ncbi:MAG: ABC transporter permease, partial [Alphaproteobacteria bacterium]
TMVAGDWWPEDYRGPPLVSFDEAGARGMGLELGDTLTLSVLGRRIEARIASLRRIDWRDFGINFLVILDPGAMKGAPHSHVATARATPEAEARLVEAVGDRFANVSAIPVRAMLLALNDIVGAVATALRGTAGITLLAGMLVLAGVVAADRQRRIYDSTILKVLGATRADLLKAYGLEFSLLGLIAGMVAALLGSAGAWLFVTQVLEDAWTFMPVRVAWVVVLGIATAAAIGFLGTWRALGHKPMPVLRTE